MFDLKIAKLLKKNETELKKDAVGVRKLLTKYKAPYQIGEVVCLVGFYSVIFDTQTNLSISELEDLFRKRKIKSSDIKFDIKHVVIGEQHEYTLSKHGHIAFNDSLTPTLIAINQYPKYNEGNSSKYTWGFIELQEYFKVNPVPNLKYIDSKYAISTLSESEFIPKRLIKTLSVVVNSYFGSLNVSL